MSVYQIIIVGSFLGSMSSPAKGSWPDLQYQVYVSSCGTVLILNQEVAGHLHHICASIVPMDICCHVGHYCSTDLQLSKTADGFSPVQTFQLHRTFQHHKSQPAWRKFLDQCQPDSPYSVSRCPVSSTTGSCNQVLVSSQAPWQPYVSLWESLEHF